MVLLVLLEDSLSQTEKKKKEYYHYVLGKYSVFCSQRKEMLYKTPGIDAS